MKLAKFCTKLYIFHIVFVIVAFIGILPLWIIVEHLPFLYSGITGFFYIVSMYSISWNFGKLDARGIEGFYPDRALPVKAALISSVVSVGLFLLSVYYSDIWNTEIGFINGEHPFFMDNCYLAGTTDLIFRCWFLPFLAFMGSRNLVAYIIIILIQPVVVIVGYNVGLTKFEIMDKVVGKLVYKKKIEQQQQNQKSPWNK